MPEFEETLCADTSVLDELMDQITILILILFHRLGVGKGGLPPLRVAQLADVLQSSRYEQLMDQITILILTLFHRLGVGKGGLPPLRVAQLADVLQSSRYEPLRGQATLPNPQRG